MNFFRSTKIAVKLPAIIGVVCIAVTTAVGSLSYFESQRIIMDESRKAFAILTEERLKAIETWFVHVQENLVQIGNAPTTAAALNAFGVSYNLLTDNPQETYQKAYITDNPHPIGERDLLDRAPDTVPYHFQHATYHPFFREIKNSRGYYDVFLMNPAGEVVYSVFKENDYATNLITGDYSGSGLARAFSAALEIQKGAVHFEDFSSYAPSAGAPAAFLSTPIYDADGGLIGVLAIQLPSAQISSIINNPHGLGETGDMFLVGQDGLARTSSRFADRFDVLSPLPERDHLSASMSPEGRFFPDALNSLGVHVIAKVVPVKIGGVEWSLFSEVNRAEVLEPVSKLRNQVITIALIAAALATLLGWFTAKTVTTPLSRLGEGMKAVSNQNFDRVIDDTDREDEIGALANILINFRDKLQKAQDAESAREILQKEQEEAIDQLSKALTALADGDLGAHIEVEFSGDYDTLRRDYNRTLENLNETIGSVVTGADTIGKRVNKMSKSSDELSRRTENQAATLEETAAALDELTVSVKAAATGAKEVERIVADARTDADESGPVVHNAVSAMAEIEKSSDEISQIIGVIDDIAFQTNLLALNAGVEAARAGDAGRGFAVVASEVRALAQRSSDAAKEIKGLISGSSEQVRRGASLVGEAGEVLTKIVDRIAHISGLIGEIASGAEEQSTGLGEINIGVTQLDQVTQQNAAMVEDATASSHALNGDAERLTEMVSRFKLPGQPKITSNARKEEVVIFNSPRAQTEKPKPMATAKPAPNPRPETAPLKATGTDSISGDATWEDF